MAAYKYLGKDLKDIDIDYVNSLIDELKELYKKFDALLNEQRSQSDRIKHLEQLNPSEAETSLLSEKISAIQSFVLTSDYREQQSQLESVGSDIKNIYNIIKARKPIKKIQWLKCKLMNSAKGYCYYARSGSIVMFKYALVINSQEADIAQGFPRPHSGHYIFNGFTKMGSSKNQIEMVIDHRTLKTDTAVYAKGIIQKGAGIYIAEKQD